MKDIYVGPDDLPSRISHWLTNQGYPLEMEVARALQSPDVDVELSDTYQDFDTKLSREIDVTVNSWDEPALGLNFQVSFHISCKSSLEKPWVSFVSKRHHLYDIPFNIFASNIARTFLIERFKDAAVSGPLRSLLLLSPDKVSHGVTQAFTTGKDVPYEAITTAAKSAIDRTTNFDEQFANTASGKPGYNLSVAFPLVVIDARLFECSLAEDDNLSLQEVPSTVVHWKGLNPLHTSSLIHIFTKPAVSHCREMIAAAIEVFDSLMSAHASELTAIGENIRKRRATYTFTSSNF